MRKYTGILRSFVVFGLILGAGWFGLWFLGKYGTEIKIKNPDVAGTSQNISENEKDEFYNIGGETPQETISLFVDALLKNNLVLAVKYFVPEAREKESEDLTRLKDAGILGDLIRDLKNLKNGSALDGAHYLFKIFDEMGQMAAEVELIKNKNGSWKLMAL
ncbi:MAG: hypothetical protein Q7K16_00235 [Candidatus Azambacteria bacterium]|nr:hypothetical protein [Candidatus Azambacteria bacterium]